MKPDYSIQPDRDKENLPSIGHALVCFVGLLIWVCYGVLELEAGLHGILLIGTAWVAANVLVLGCSYTSMRTGMMAGMMRAMPALFIFVLIGVVIATFIMSGTIGTLVYYGLKFLQPAIFLPIGLLLCSLMSLAIGTSWGTVGTGGIILMSIGSAMNIPLPLVAGMVISGASFGDKMSPVSDTTNLAALSSGTDLYAHIKSMLYTTLPSYIIIFIAFSWLGSSYANQALPEDELQLLLNGLDATFEINLFMLLPMVVLIVLAMRKLAAEAAMLVAALIAMLLAIFVQSVSFNQVLTGVYDGAWVDTGVEMLDSLFNRGGIKDIAQTFMLAVIAIVMGALLEKFGFLKVLIEAMISGLKQQAAIVSTTIVSVFGGNMALSESYVSIILGGQLFKDVYDKTGLDRSVLSRSLEEGGTLTAALIPWTTTGAFYTATLGIATFEYLPWALFNWLSPLIAILFAWLGFGLIQRKSVTTL